jgi:hypothetical protein
MNLHLGGQVRRAVRRLENEGMPTGFDEVGAPFWLLSLAVNEIIALYACIGDGVAASPPQGGRPSGGLRPTRQEPRYPGPHGERPGEDTEGDDGARSKNILVKHGLSGQMDI